MKVYANLPRSELETFIRQAIRGGVSFSVEPWPWDEWRVTVKDEPFPAELLKLRSFGTLGRIEE